MATGAVWENQPGVGLVLTDPGTSGLAVGTTIPWNADGEHYAATRNFRVAGSTGDGTPEAAANPGGPPSSTSPFVDVPAGGGTTGLAAIARQGRAASGWPMGEMSPYEVLAQTIELASEIGTPGGEGPLTADEVHGWVAEIDNSSDQWGMVQTIRSNILKWRVTPAQVAETYDISIGEADALVAPGGDIKAFLEDRKVYSGDDSETAASIIRDSLRDYGLEGLVDNENLRLIDRWVETGDMDAVWAAVKQTPEYEGRFPGMEALAAAGRAISEGTYIEMERAYAQTLQAYDMPKTFYDDPSDFGTLIGGDVSINEFTQRVATAFEAANGTTAEVRDALDTYYGINDSDLAAYYLDPERATSIFEERERLGAARLGGIAAETGFGSINRQTAERLQAAGVTDTMARRGFQEVAQSTLAEESVGDVGDITRTDLVGDKFGTDPESARRIEERRQRRLAAFSQSGGPVMTQGGYTGLGAAT